MGERGHINCNASLSQPNVQKNSRAHVRGRGGLKFEKKMLEKLGRRSPAFCTFHSPQPNNIGPAWQQPRSLFLISLGLVAEGRGAQLLHISFAITGLHGICNESKTKWKIGVGGTHSSPTALGLGISAPHPRIQNAEFGLGLGGGTKVFYPLRPDYRRFKIPSFTSPGHTHSHVLSAEL